MNSVANINNPPLVFRPQPGPQEAFLSSSADIVIYGGAAGGGKTFGMLLEPLRHITNNRKFHAVVFRRNGTQIRNPGGLWDESYSLYPYLNARPISTRLEWKWPHGGTLKFAHLDEEKTVLEWQGSQVPLIGFDELTHFTQTQFFYMLSRNRSVSGVKPYVRATTNPDADSWVAKLIEWWIDQETGYPIQERSGVIRWMVRVGDEILWSNSRQEAYEKFGLRDDDGELLPEDHEEQIRPKSMTFIPAKLSDNKALMKADPDYRANLMAMSFVERERLLGGNWKVRPAAGLYFKRNEVTIVDTIPDDIEKIVRGWDLAATEPTEQNPDPDWTAGVCIAKRKNGRFIILHCEKDRKRSHLVRELVKRVAQNDSYRVKISIAQDPGQAGKDQAESYVKLLAGFNVTTSRETGDKFIRADGYAAQWQAGNIDILRGPWNEPFLAEHEQFGGGVGHDDQVDAASRAFNELTGANLSVWKKLANK